METNRRLALLIDGDNAEAKLLPQIIETVNAHHGVITIRRVFGKWTKPLLKTWTETIVKCELTKIQSVQAGSGKNTTDFALVISAMDILHTTEVDGFCIVSSDGDFRPLVERLKQQKLFVLGVGHKPTPLARKGVCNLFIDTQKFQHAKTPTPKAKVTKPNKAQVSPIKPMSKAKAKAIRNHIKSALDSVPLDDSWALLTAVGDYLHANISGFDLSEYGHSKLSRLVAEFPDEFELRPPKSSAGNTIIYVRLKAEKPSENSSQPKT